ncbi:MAG: hypothetical protein ACJAUP_001893 [Cellvibrionaceae bacterium]
MKKLSASIICSAICSTGIITASALFSQASNAETVVVPIGQQGSQQSTQRPTTGNTKTQVKNQYGEPNRWRLAVGQPPISSWVYDGFTVYFEYDRVIHAVLTR